jgi:hypothetical protein
VWHNALSSNIVSGDVTINGTSFSKANSYINAGAWIRLTNGVGFYTDASDYFYNYSGAGWQIRGGQAGATANYLLFQESNGTVRHNITWNSTNLHLYNYNNGVTLRLIPNATYGSISIVGSTGGYGGIRLESASYAPNWMWSTSAVNGGVYFEGLGLWSIYYNYAHHGDRASWFIGTSLYQVPYCTWSANGGSSNAKFSRGTAAPSGGTDGDVYFQYT